MNKIIPISLLFLIPLFPKAYAWCSVNNCGPCRGAYQNFGLEREINFWLDLILYKTSELFQEISYCLPFR